MGCHRYLANLRPLTWTRPSRAILRGWSRGRGRGGPGGGVDGGNERINITTGTWNTKNFESVFSTPSRLIVVLKLE